MNRPVLTAVLVLLLAGSVGVGLARAGGPAKSERAGPQDEPKVQSMAVIRTDLSDTREMDGTLGFGAPRAINGPGDGMVTWLPAVATTVKRGQPLFRINERPTVLFYGSTPVYRRLDVRGMLGRDVRTVANNLSALGYDIGHQPAPGSTVRQDTTPTENPAPGPTTPRPTATALPDPTPAQGSADRKAVGQIPGGPAAQPNRPGRWVKVGSGEGVLTTALVAAIKRWQPTAGLAPTGILEPTDVVVAKGAIRVSQLSARAGDQASAELMAVTATTKRVTVAVDVLDVGSIKRHLPVTVTLPDQSTIPGQVTTISTAVRGSDGAQDGGGEAQLTVVVGFQKQATALKTLDAAQVQVSFTAQTRKDVLAVPVGALLALREGGYGVQTTGGKLVAVKTGLFARGMVEISGTGLAEGTSVDTTS